MRTESQHARVTKRPRRGRPTQVSATARSERVVTFVTERERESLEGIAIDEDRSLSAVVHRIIAQHLKHAR